MSEKKDFFISYNKADRQNAEWIAWILEDAGYTAKIQAWDFLAGSNFVLEMQNASVTCEYTVAVLSQAYIDALFTQPEWAAAFRSDPTGKMGKLIPVRAENIDIEGMLGSIVYIDLVGIQEEEAKQRLLSEIKHILEQSRRKPLKKPSFNIIPNKAEQIAQKPAFNPIPVTFARLRLGSTDELVGRQDSLEWLDNKLLKSNGCTCALASLQGMGGMGKTFLSQVFAEKNKENAIFYPVYLGDTSPFNAGMQLLQKQGIDTSQIDTDTKLTDELQRFYQNGTGILILDDVRTSDTRLLFPQSDKWSVLVTTRDKGLARNLCGDKNVKELDILIIEDALLLMRKVLENNFRESQIDDYIKLCNYLTCRPYSIRLAAGYLLNAIDPNPLLLLERLKAGKPVSVDDDLDFNKIVVLLNDCIDQLEKKSSLAMKLVRALSVGADQGMPLDRLVQWQRSANGYDVISIENALIAGRDSGIFLVESVINDSQERRILRLHSDLLRLLRKEESREMVDSLVNYLEDLLVKRTYEPTLDRLMYLQEFALVERYKNDESIIRILYNKFWGCFNNTGELQHAFYLGKLFFKSIEKKGNKEDLQRSFGDQASLYRAWGKLESAMELLKKQEPLCIEIGNCDGLLKNYNNQTIILTVWGKLEESMALLKKQESICNEFGNKNALRAVYGNQAIILKDWGLLDDAMELHKKEEAICYELGNKDGLSSSLSNQAIILAIWGRTMEALELHKKTEAISIELGDKSGLQASYHNQAIILKTLGKLVEAMELHKKADAICIELGSKDGLSKSLSAQGLILKSWGKLDDAMVLYKREETLCEELNDKIGLMRSFGNQANIFYLRGKLDCAMELFKKQEAICVEVGLKPSLKICYRNQINLYMKMEKKTEAEEFRQKLAALERVMKSIK